MINQTSSWTDNTVAFGPTSNRREQKDVSKLETVVTYWDKWSNPNRFPRLKTMWWKADATFRRHEFKLSKWSHRCSIQPLTHVKFLARKCTVTGFEWGAPTETVLSPVFSDRTLVNIFVWANTFWSDALGKGLLRLVLFTNLRYDLLSQFLPTHLPLRKQKEWVFQCYELQSFLSWYSPGKTKKTLDFSWQLDLRKTSLTGCLHTSPRSADIQSE